VNQEAFSTRVRVSNDTFGAERCWKWNLEQEANPRVWIAGKSVPVRRAIYQRFRDHGLELAGPLPPRTPLVATCGNDRCVNPYHMAPAVSAKALKAQGKPTSGANDPRGAHYRKRDHCPFGHLFTPSNTHIDADGRRHCKLCNRIRNGPHWPLWHASMLFQPEYEAAWRRRWKPLVPVAFPLPETPRPPEDASFDTGVNPETSLVPVS